MTRRGPVVVVGDTLLDRDVDGVVERLCPDAPVPVLDEQAETERPGGAGLAALLAAGQGREVVLVTALAGDAGGARLSRLLAGVEVHALALTGPTPEKIRLRAGDRTLLRLDRGGAGGRCGEPASPALAALRDAAVILVSDYGRGVARQPALRAALSATAAPVVWDPHPRGPVPIRNTRLATPNEAEVRHLAGYAGRDPLATAHRGGEVLRQRWRAAAVAVTMGERGALLCHAGPTPLVAPAPRRADGDTCGAGDAFAVTAALAIADGAPVTEAVPEAVTRATAYVAAGGARAALAGAPDPAGAAWSAGEPADAGGVPAAAGLVARVRARGGRVVATGGCFDLLHAGHVATLQAARRLGDCLVVCLNSDASVARLKGPSRPVNHQDDRRRVLAALECVDAVVVFDEPTPYAVLSWLRPDVWVKGADYADRGLPEAELLRRWEGQAVLVPYLAGRSTTALVAARNGDRGKR